MWVLTIRIYDVIFMSTRMLYCKANIVADADQKITLLIPSLLPTSNVHPIVTSATIHVILSPGTIQMNIFYELLKHGREGFHHHNIVTQGFPISLLSPSGPKPSGTKTNSMVIHERLSCLTIELITRLLVKSVHKSSIWGKMELKQWNFNFKNCIATYT